MGVRCGFGSSYADCTKSNDPDYTNLVTGSRCAAIENQFIHIRALSTEHQNHHLVLLSTVPEDMLCNSSKEYTLSTPYKLRGEIWVGGRGRERRRIRYTSLNFCRSGNVYYSLLISP